ncbi:helix-turn-helix transcriptional regulator [Rurimicrobium arvi]|uniref:AlpA family phage regulatory protein n=1 Tax=Rurimicrobium arvi TaxID=2049916 RepID=A0ABP8N134_9BACT
MNTPSLPEEFLRLPDVLRRIKISKSTFYRYIKQGAYPKPVFISPGAKGWKVQELEACFEKLNSEKFM